MATESALLPELDSPTYIGPVPGMSVELAAAVVLESAAVFEAIVGCRLVAPDHIALRVVDKLNLPSVSFASDVCFE